jgi:hypothetical protein
MGEGRQELPKAARQFPQDLCGEIGCLTVFQCSNSGHVLMIYQNRTIIYAVGQENRARLLLEHIPHPSGPF